MTTLWENRADEPDWREWAERTEVNVACSGCGEMLVTEADFARHFVLSLGPQYKNLGRCPKASARHRQGTKRVS